MKASGQPLAVTAPKVAPKAASSRKRKSETSLEDDIAAYKQNLDHVTIDHLLIDMSCNQVRGKMNRLLDNSIMKKGELCKTMGCSHSSVNTFLAKRGSMEGSKCLLYYTAWAWFKQREIAGLKMPDVKKRQKTEAAAASDSNTNGGSTNNVAVPLAPTTDISDVHLDGEETDSAPVYDTCDEIRKKINEHLKTPGLTAAQFCRDIYAQLHRPKGKPFQSKQLNDFRGKKGPNAGCTSQLFYAAYVYFEKKRIAEGRPKSQHRLKMEEIWPRKAALTARMMEDTGE